MLGKVGLRRLRYAAVDWVVRRQIVRVVARGVGGAQALADRVLELREGAGVACKGHASANALAGAVEGGDAPLCQVVADAAAARRATVDGVLVKGRRAHAEEDGERRLAVQHRAACWWRR